MSKENYNKISQVLINGSEVFKGHFDQCVTVAGGYPNQTIIIKPIK